MAKLVILKSFMDAYYDNMIEKSTTHKYIRRVPKPSGKGYNYFYAKDFKTPFKALLSLFGMKEDKIDKAYENNNIQKDYGVTKQSFAQHVLEYLTNRKTWNAFFANKANREKYKTPEKPVKETETVKVSEKEIIGGKTKVKEKVSVEEKEIKEKKSKPAWNRSLMRKIYSMYNSVPEDKLENNPTAEEVTEIATENAAKQDVNGTNEAVREEVTETVEEPKVEYRDSIKKEAQEILDDYASNKTPKYTLEERNKIINSSKALKWIVEHAKPVELENPSKRAIVEIGNSPIFEKVNGAFSGKVPYAMNKNIVKEIVTINTGSYDPTKDHLGDKSTTLEYYDENGNEVVETFYLQKPTYNGDPYKMSYTIRVFDKEKTKDVAEKIVNGEDFEVPDTKNEFEEYLNRSQAMMGNQNAKKDLVETDEKTADEVANMEKDKAEFKGLVDRLNELNKEFSANGGYSNRRTTREEDEKRRAAQKEIREVEAKLVEFRKRITEENKGNFKIPSVYHDAINEWIKRKVKGQTISAEWLRKKFGGYYSDALSFGDGYSLALGDTETIDNPSVRINYEDKFKRPGYVVVDLKEMEEKENYRPRYMPQDDASFTEVWKKVNNLKEQLTNASGSTISEKFFNTVMGISNAYNENSDTSNIPRYRFTKDGIKDKGGKLEKIDATIREDSKGNEYIRLYADDYGASIPSIFYPENNTDIQTDYFEKDSCSVFPDHPYYNHLKLMALKRELYRGRATKWASLSKEQQKDIENKIKDLEKQLKEPTEEELKAYRERRDIQEENREKWKEAQSRVYQKEMEERQRKADNEKVSQFKELLNKFAEALEKEPPVNLKGLSKNEKIETLENRISKLSLEIANLSDAETVESKKKYREKLKQVLEQVKNSPDTEPEETEVEEHNNRSEAMMGNDNASGFRLVQPEEYEVKEENVISTEEPKTVEEAKNELNDLESQIGQGNGFELDKKLNAARDNLARAKMDERDAQDGVVTPIPKIDSETARRVSDISMSGNAGSVYQHDVNVEMNEFRDKFNVSKMNPQQKAYFQERLNAYAGLVGSSYNEMASKRLAAGPSWVVAGPAKFNNKRFAQKMDAERRAFETFEEKKDKFIKNTEKRLKELKYTGGSDSVEDVKKKVFDDYSKGKWSYGDKIDNTDPYAIEKISGKIKFMEDSHDVTLLYNKMCKKNGITNWSWSDRTDEDKAKRREVLTQTMNEAKEKGYSDEAIKQGIEHPFTQNQNADIRRNKQRLEELQKRQEKIEERKASESNSESGSNSNTGRVDFDGGYVYENPELDRIQIIYDGKPERDVIDKLKHNGFRWSPSQRAWQRQLHRNGRSAVNRVFAETGINTKIDIDGAGEVTKSLPKFVIKNGRFLIRK